MGDAEITKHLKGEKTYGTYVIREDGKVTFGVIDIDGDPNYLPALERLGNIVYDSFPKHSRVLEFSGRKGYHIWVFFKQPENPAFVKELIKTRLKRIGLKNIEIFPKQDRVTGKGLGNLIKLPFGIHQVSGKWSKLIKEEWLE